MTYSQTDRHKRGWVAFHRQTDRQTDGRHIYRQTDVNEDGSHLAYRQTDRHKRG